VRTRRGLGEDSTRTRALKERKGKEGNSKGICTLESVKPFLTWWGEQFKEHCHDIYICNFQKDTPIVKELIRAFGDVEVRKRAVRFLSDHGDFVTRAGHTIGVFKTKINSYSDEVVNGKSRNNNSENNGGVKPPTGKYANVGK
jgi:hypothetical protein